MSCTGCRKSPGVARAVLELAWTLHPGSRRTSSGSGLKPLAQLDFQGTREKGNGGSQVSEPAEEKEMVITTPAATAKQLQLKATK